jgi:hypothetical protein
MEVITLPVVLEQQTKDMQEEPDQMLEEIMPLEVVAALALLVSLLQTMLVETEGRVFLHQ